MLVVVWVRLVGRVACMALNPNSIYINRIVDADPNQEYKGWVGGLGQELPPLHPLSIS